MKLNKTKTELKQIIRTALESEYGFAPAISKIVLLEASGDGTYIMASINGKEYQFHSRLCWQKGLEGTVWCGAGTITRFED